jgi:hypothetical protein
MRQQLYEAIDWIGKGLLVWFLFETFRYFYYGSFFDEVRMIPQLFEAGFSFMGIYTILRIPVAAIGALILIPLLLKGHWVGLLLGLLYWGMGYLTNPFWFIVPFHYQITAERKAMPALLFINYFWAALTLLIIVSFYFHRRSLKKLRMAPNQSLQEGG